MKQFIVFLVGFLLSFYQLANADTFQGHGLGLVKPDNWQSHAEYLNILQSKDLPDHFDWREKLGKEPAILNQGSCGSCWAFSRVMTLTWQYLIQGLTVTPSPQELVSCDREEMGCNGGYWDDYEVSTGISNEADFPYHASNMRCKKNLPHQHKIAKWLFIGTNGQNPTTEEMKQAIFQYGPIGVTVAVTGDFPDGCDSGETNHMVVVTGWSVDENGKTVWDMQNSWGKTWGDNGYANIPEGCFNIGETAAIPVLK